MNRPLATVRDQSLLSLRSGQPRDLGAQFATPLQRLRPVQSAPRTLARPASSCFSSVSASASCFARMSVSYASRQSGPIRDGRLKAGAMAADNFCFAFEADRHARLP